MVVVVCCCCFCCIRTVGLFDKVETAVDFGKDAVVDVDWIVLFVVLVSNDLVPDCCCCCVGDSVSFPLLFCTSSSTEVSVVRFVISTSLDPKGAVGSRSAEVFPVDGSSSSLSLLLFLFSERPLTFFFPKSLKGDFIGEEGNCRVIVFQSLSVFEGCTQSFLTLTFVDLARRARTN